MSETDNESFNLFGKHLYFNNISYILVNNNTCFVVTQIFIITEILFIAVYSLVLALTIICVICLILCCYFKKGIAMASVLSHVSPL